MNARTSRGLSRNGAWNKHPWLDDSTTESNVPNINWKTPTVILTQGVPVNKDSNEKSASKPQANAEE